MAYDQFALDKVEADFGLTTATALDLFPGVPPVPVPAPYRDRQRVMTAFAISEAGRAQCLIAPLLIEVWLAAAGRIALFPGVRFDVDEAAGLTGVCDHILGLPPQLDRVKAPVMMVVEAKNDDLWGGLGQCAAAVVAARRFNAGRNPHIAVLHGAVTDGERWRFIRLAADPRLEVEVVDRSHADADVLFGILLHICGLHPASGGK